MAEIKKVQENETLWFADHVIGLVHQISKSEVKLDTNKILRRIQDQSDNEPEIRAFLDQVESNHPGFFKTINDLRLNQPALKMEYRTDSIEIDQNEFAGFIHIGTEGVSVWLDESLKKQGVIIDSLGNIKRDHIELIENIHQDYAERKGSALANVIGSLAGDAIVLHIPQDIVVDRLIGCEITPSKAGFSPLQFISHLNRDAKAGFVFTMPAETRQSNHAVLAVAHKALIGVNASFQFFWNQQASDDVLVVVDNKVQQKNLSSTEVFSLDLGGCGVEQVLSIDLVGEGSESVISGLYRPGPGSRYFYHTDQLHHGSHSKSDLEYKGVLGKEAYASWNGNILVDENTVGTNGYQANHNLIIDESAKVESVPGLEILTDDVRCSHGVTIGNIDKTHMFYLQSRGINEEDAEALIIDGFLEAALKRIKSEKLLNNILQSFNKRL